jgi:hypothetical protein
LVRYTIEIKEWKQTLDYWRAKEKRKWKERDTEAF